MFVCPPFSGAYKCVWRCGFPHPVDDLFNGVQADNSGAFLVGPCVPGFALCARQTHTITSPQPRKRKQLCAYYPSSFCVVANSHKLTCLLKFWGGGVPCNNTVITDELRRAPYSCSEYKAFGVVQGKRMCMIYMRLNVSALNMVGNE